ncbi:MAG TPA: thioredoxin family protein [Alphaproteobacteria bacterium]|nr:thioredoxin family protein [Alphaproteobacteria bacterium]
MTTTSLSAPNIVSREDWLAARKALLAKEKAMTREFDELRAERRRLPWTKVEKPYLFEGPQGKCTLADLFRGRSQLAVYHFMLAPGSDHICPGCSFIADHIDAARQHFEQADLSFAAISRAPLERIEQVRQRLGWTFPWVSSHGTDFNYDFGVSFRKEDIAAGRAIYNYGTAIKSSEDMHGTSIFARDGSGDVFHTYSTYYRGDESLIGAFMWLDLTPKGRNEDDGVMSWVKLHDEYETARAPRDGCCR